MSLLLSLTAALLAYKLIRWAGTRAAKQDKAEADRELVRSINAGTYRIPPHRAPRVMADLFARPSEDAEAETLRYAQRAWRERRAVLGRDHLTRHSVDAVCDSEAATEIMQFTVGGWEIDR